MYDSEEQTVQTTQRYELFHNDRLIETELETFALRFYEKDEFQQILETTGFIDIRATRVYENVEPDFKDTTIVFECRKP